MKSALIDLTGAEFPLFAFSHCRDVVVAVSRAGGFGVLGAATFSPEQLEQELRWIESHVDGKPFGVDLLIPENFEFTSDLTGQQLADMVPHPHIDFTQKLLERHGVPATPEELVLRETPTWTPGAAEALLKVAFHFPIRLLVNALGIVPPLMLEMGRKHGIPIGALVGSKQHAVRQVEAGVDLLVAQGGEAGGHCGEVSTLVLVPEVVRAIKAVREVPVLAAGGIVTGEQMAACVALGAQGAWTGTVWLSTAESDLSQVLRDKIVGADSRDTVRSKARTGKYSRQLHTPWHDAWDGPDSPGTLPMPLMGMLSEPALAKAVRQGEQGGAGARELATYFVGQGVGLIDQPRTAGAIVQQFKEEYISAAQILSETISIDS
jgi:NAD(P)H-dependent flavin oxidoreductase YrpB (nitropropane dioxygenase family)